MDKRKNIGFKVLITLLVVLFLSLLSLVLYVEINNRQKKTFSGSIGSPNDKFELKLVISKSWANGEGENLTYGQQFDFTIIDNKKYDLKKWTLTFDINAEGYELVTVDSYWNVEYENNGKTFTVTPDETIDLASIKKAQNNAFGFVLINKIEVNASDASNVTYTLNGTSHRKYTSYASFWIVLVYLFSVIAYAASYFVITIREKRFEKFKEHTYSVISQSMNTFGSLIDTKDPYTKDHSARVSYYAVKLARKMGLDDEFVRNIAYIALMHDCGKLIIPDEILTKPARLTNEEFAIMKTHTSNGGKALENFTSIEGIKEGAMYHHERWDGKGYPEGLKGEEIPLRARIICVADALDAMASDRCYRKRLDENKIISELKENAGSQFDPNIAALAIEMIQSKEINIEDEE
jgi:HD-GYP domain-containing protein (c-di-GMP phosphodiesterase class II)